MSVLASLMPHVLTATRPGGLTLLRRVAIFWSGVDRAWRTRLSISILFGIINFQNLLDLSLLR